MKKKPLFLLSLLLLLFVLSSVKISSVKAASFSDGFESNSFGYWTGTEGTPGETETITTITPHSGTYAALFYCNGNDTNEESEAYKYLDWTQIEANLTFWLRVSTNFPTDGNSFIVGKFGAADGTDLVYAKVRNLWGLYVRLKLDYRVNGVWTSKIYNGTNLALDTWYQVTIYEYINATVGAVSMKLNGATILSASGIKNDNYGNIQRFAVGEIYDSEIIEHNIRIDDVVFVGTDSPTTPPETGNGELLFSTDFSDVVKSSDRYLTKVGQPIGTFALNLQGGNPLRSWFEYDDVRDTFWVDDTMNPTRSNTPSSGHGGQRYVIGMETAYAQRNEFNLINIQDWLTTDTLYTSVWLYFPIGWDLNQADNWYDFFNPVGGVYAPYLPASTTVIWKDPSGTWFTTVALAYPTSTEWYINTVTDFHPPIGEWFNVKCYIKSSSTHGTIKVWVNNQIIADSDRDVPVGSLHYQDMVTAQASPFAWLQAIANVYHGPNPTLQNPLQLWVSDLKIYDNLPSTADTTPPTYNSVAHNTTKNSQTVQFSAQFQDNVALSSYTFSWNGSGGTWLNDTRVRVSGTSAWTNTTKLLPSGIGLVIGYRWYANDTSSNWNITLIFTLTTTASNENINILLNSPGHLQIRRTNTVTFTYMPIFVVSPLNASLWIKATGISWQRVAWNASDLVSGAYNAINYTFSASKTYVWNIQVFNSTKGVFSQGNRSLFVILEPYYGDVTYSTTYTETLCTFSAEWFDGDGLSGFIFSTNITGSWANETWTEWPTTANLTVILNAFATEAKTLPETSGVLVRFRFYANDTDNRWTASTIYDLVTEAFLPPPIEPPSAVALSPLWQWLSGGDLLGFLQAIYVLAFGSADILYGMVFAVIFGAIYIRTRSLILMVILWLLVGSFLVVALPLVASIGVVLIIMGVAGMLYQLFKPHSQSY